MNYYIEHGEWKNHKYIAKHKSKKSGKTVYEYSRSNALANIANVFIKYKNMRIGDIVHNLVQKGISYVFDKISNSDNANDTSSETSKPHSREKRESDVSASVEKQKLEHSDDELMHYGVLGMKWGIRRYQNYNGTLTSEGAARVEKHYKKSKQKVSDLEFKKNFYQNKIYKMDKKANKILSKRPEDSDWEILDGFKTVNEQDKLAKIQRKSDKYSKLRDKYAKQAEKFIAAREKEFAKINYDSIPKSDIDKGKEYTIYINALQSRNSAEQMVKAQYELLNKL